MRKGMALLAGVAIAIVTINPVQASSISFDPAGGSAEAVAAVDSAIGVFETSFSARASCIGSASVIFESLSGRMGEYRTAEAVVAVNPDREAGTMAATVYHELAHHVMLTCRAHRDSDFMAAFYAAQDIPVDRGWFDGSAGWSGIPAEQFAEAAVVVVQGTAGGGIAVSSEAVDTVRRWLNGQPMPVAATPVAEENAEKQDATPAPAGASVTVATTTEPSPAPAATETAVAPVGAAPLPTTTTEVPQPAPVKAAATLASPASPAPEAIQVVAAVPVIDRPALQGPAGANRGGWMRPE
ncbi:MAG: hypothetical protein P1T08_07730 [Acidimicrobiia bacterium]|nr:hypothetical protein [Acidimicrobiia bacterium]